MMLGLLVVKPQLWWCHSIQWDNKNLTLDSWDCLTVALTLFSLFYLHDLDGVCMATLPGTHVMVALCEGIRGGQVPVLSVHVVCVKQE